MPVAGIAAEEGDGSLHVLTDETDHAHVLERVHENEQSCKEQQRCPLHVVKRFLEFMTVGGQQHDNRSDKRNPRDGNVGDGVEEEIQDNKEKNDACNVQHGLVLDAVLGFKFSNITNPCPRKFVGIEPLEEHEAWNHAHQNPRTHLDDEIVERHAVMSHVSVKPAFGFGNLVGRKPRTDHDVWWVAYHRGRTTDVRKQHLRNQQWNGFDVKHFRQLNGDRGEQEHGRDVVQERRQNSRHRTQYDHKGPDGAAALLVGKDGEILENPRVG